MIDTLELTEREQILDGLVAAYWLPAVGAPNGKLADHLVDWFLDAMEIDRILDAYWNHDA